MERVSLETDATGRQFASGNRRGPLRIQPPRTESSDPRPEASRFRRRMRQRTRNGSARRAQPASLPGFGVETISQDDTTLRSQVALPST